MEKTFAVTAHDKIGNQYTFHAYGIQPKEWPAGGYGLMVEDNAEYFGNRPNTFRIKTDRAVIESLTIIITIVHPEKFRRQNVCVNGWECNCHIEFPNDGEPSTHTTGRIFFDTYEVE